MPKYISVRSIVSTVSFIAIFPTQAIADQREDSGFYLGGGVGVVSIDGGDFDGDNTVPQVFVGWQLNPYLGIEASYLDFGDYSDASSSFDATGFSLAGTLRFPLTERFAIYGKAGQMKWESEFADSNDFRANFDDNEMFYGVGLSFEATNYLDIRVSYDRFEFSLSRIPLGLINRDFSSDVDIVTVGLNLEF